MSRISDADREDYEFAKNQFDEITKRLAEKYKVPTAAFPALMKANDRQRFTEVMDRIDAQHAEYRDLEAAKSMKTESPRLLELATHANPEIRLAVALNSRSPKSALRLLCFDPEFEIRRRLFKDRRSPMILSLLGEEFALDEAAREAERQAKIAAGAPIRAERARRRAERDALGAASMV